MESTKMRSAKLLITIKHLKHKERLQRLKLLTLRFRCIRGGMTEGYKILTYRYCRKCQFTIRNTAG